MRADGSTTKSAKMSTRNRSATSTPSTKIRAMQSALQSTLMRLSEMVGRRLREGGYFARTLQLKLRYKDFTTITRAHSLDEPTQMDHQIFEQARRLFFAQLEGGCAGAVVGSAGVEFRIWVRPARFAGAIAARALAEGAGGCGSSARQVWGIGDRPGARDERRIPRACARKSGSVAGQSEEKA